MAYHPLPSSLAVYSRSLAGLQRLASWIVRDRPNSITLPSSLASR